MKIELISQSEYDFLVKLAMDYPNLVFQNDGYEYIKKSKLSEEDLQKIDLLNSFLKKHIVGFSKFYNFRNGKKDGKLQIRFDYNYNYDGKGNTFIGVGYINVDELLNGFEDER